MNEELAVLLDKLIDAAKDHGCAERAFKEALTNFKAGMARLTQDNLTLRSVLMETIVTYGMAFDLSFLQKIRNMLPEPQHETASDRL